jgi:hypothetical protein
MVDIYAGHGKIEIAGVELEPNDVYKLNKILDGEYKIAGKGTNIEEQQTQSIDQKLVLQQSIADAKMTALMG